MSIQTSSDYVLICALWDSTASHIAAAIILPPPITVRCNQTETIMPPQSWPEQFFTTTVRSAVLREFLLFVCEGRWREMEERTDLAWLAVSALGLQSHQRRFLIHEGRLMLPYGMNAPRPSMVINPRFVLWYGYQPTSKLGFVLWSKNKTVFIAIPSTEDPPLSYQLICKQRSGRISDGQASMALDYFKKKGASWEEISKPPAEIDPRWLDRQSIPDALIG
jgi:hypothetical protein